MTSPPSDSGDAHKGEDVPESHALARLNDSEVERIAAAVFEHIAARPQRPTDIRLTEYMSYVAPLQPPEWYDGYEQVVPGAGHRILTMVEDEGKHRRWFDRAYANSRVVAIRLREGGCFGACSEGRFGVTR